MSIDLYWIPNPSTGRLGIMPRPRGGDWLEDEIKALLDNKVDVLVSLLEPDEIHELNLMEERVLCHANGLTYLSLPIPDRDVPSSKQNTLHFVKEVAVYLQASQSVVIHCRQGVGRSSLIAACVLMQFGMTTDKAFESIASSRGCNVPDTVEQREWVEKFLV